MGDHTWKSNARKSCENLGRIECFWWTAKIVQNGLTHPRLWGYRWNRSIHSCWQNQYTKGNSRFAGLGVLRQFLSLWECLPWWACKFRNFRPHPCTQPWVHFWARGRTDFGENTSGCVRLPGGQIFHGWKRVQVGWKEEESPKGVHKTTCQLCETKLFRRWFWGHVLRVDPKCRKHRVINRRTKSEKGVWGRKLWVRDRVVYQFGKMLLVPIFLSLFGFFHQKHFGTGNRKTHSSSRGCEQFWEERWWEKETTVAREGCWESGKCLTAWLSQNQTILRLTTRRNWLARVRMPAKISCSYVGYFWRVGDHFQFQCPMGTRWWSPW